MDETPSAEREPGGVEMEDPLTTELEQVTREQAARVRHASPRATWATVAASLPAVVASVLLTCCYAFSRTREEAAGSAASGARGYADWHSPVHYLIEALLLLALAVLNICVTLRDARMRRTFLLRRAQAQIDAYKRRGCAERVDLADVPGELSVQRGGRNFMALANKLVRGDQVLVPLGTPFPYSADPVVATGTATTPAPPAPSSSVSAGGAAAPDATTTATASATTTAAGATAGTNGGNARSTNDDSWLTQYQIRSAPGCLQLRDAFAHRESMPPTLLEVYSRAVRRWYSVGVWAGFVLSLVASVVCYYVAPTSEQEFVTAVLAQPAYVLATPVLLALPAFLWAVVESYCNARLLALFAVLQRADAAEQALPAEAREAARAQRRREQKRRFGRVAVPGALVRRTFAELFCDRAAAVARCSNMFQTLGAVTVCVFLDKDATLIEPVPQPERLFLPAHDPAAPDQAAPAPDQAAGTTLSLSTHVADDSSVTLSFDEPAWRDYLGALKPIGLTTLLQRPLCRRADAAQTAPHICNQASLPPAPARAADAAAKAEAVAATEGPTTDRGRAAENEGRVWKDAFVALTTSFSRRYNHCLCLLTREIGFSEQAADGFERVKEIHTYASLPETLRANCAAAGTPFAAVLAREPLYMCSLVINDKKSTSYQMLSKGNAPTVLAHSASFWDGHEIRPITPDVRAAIVDHYTHLSEAYTVVAFAYRPIPPRLRWLFCHQDPGCDVRLTHMNSESPFARASVNAAGRRLVRNVFHGSICTEPPNLDDVKGPLTPGPAPAPRLATPARPKTAFRSPLRLARRRSATATPSSPASVRRPRSKTPVPPPPVALPASQAHPDGVSHDEDNEPTDATATDTTPESPTAVTASDACSESHDGRVPPAPSRLAESQIVDDDDEEVDEDEDDVESMVSSACTDAETRGHRSPEQEETQHSHQHKHHRHHHKHTHSGSRHKARPIHASTEEVVADGENVENGNEEEEEEVPVHVPVTRTHSGTPRPERQHDKRKHGFEEIETGQIFLGMAALRDIPRNEADTVIEALQTAGVHFMYFSSEDVKRSTFFASKLGLETDWNCVISLKDSADPDEQYMDGPAKLPRGISRIRTHIAEQDTVPLRVPVFCDCTPESSAEMIKILQENGAVVLCVGSAIEVRNTPAFAQANISMSMQPEPDHCMLVDNEPAAPKDLLTSANFASDPSTGNLSADLTSLPCSFVMHQKTSFSTLSTLLCEGRHVLRNTAQAALCMVTLVAALNFSIFAGSIFYTLPLFSGYQLLWLSCLMIPLLALSLLTGTVNSNVMTQLNASCQVNPALVGHTLALVASQFVPLVVFVIAQHFLTLGGLLHDWSMPFVFLVRDGAAAAASAAASGSAAARAVSAPVALLYAQNFSMLTFVLGAFVSSLILSHPSVALREMWGMARYNKGRSIAVAVVAVLQLVFAVVSLGAADAFAALAHVPWWSYVAMLGVVPVAFAAGLLALFRYHAWWNSYQLELRLIFDTKLGMYSPVATRAPNDSPHNSP